MLRPDFKRTLRLVRHILSWRTRRELRRRPGHFSIATRRGFRGLIALPFAQLRHLKHLLKPHPAAAMILATAAAIGWTMMDAEPVGADASLVIQAAEQKRPTPPPLPEDSAMHLEGRVAMLLQIAMLQDASNRLESVKSYTATFEKQERIDGELSDEQSMQFKLQHKPLNVYMKWEKGDDVGQELLFPAANDDPRLLVQLPKFGGRLPALKLEPSSALAMSKARYPVTMAGLKEMTSMTLEIRQRDIKLGDRVQVEMRDDRTFAGRSVYAYTVKYASQKDSEQYRKCILYIDKQLMVPVYSRNFTWPELVADADPNNLDATTLIESYAYRGIKLEADLSPSEFARSNPDYKFR
ncbi:MAG: DUF1571 domain-containing protein [Planctomycetota bacterium]|nr:DUF1571 domain-containing protein [Planctomycetota bacterium]MDA0918361.1 DUF1571 domain-containing protein [Planctomycetota bacterium]MDA1158086.1 DUF1571 domain-containing protein [Planctomycetota bacterium]